MAQTAQTEATVVLGAAVAQATPKAVEACQDRAGVLSTPAGRAVVVCDGVGAYAGSGAVADRCLALALEHLATDGGTAGLTACPQAVAAAMAQDEDNGATTLLAVAAEEDGRCAFTLVGNGALLALEPMIGPADRITLGFAELVLPQVEPYMGRAALRSFLPAAKLPVEEASGILLPRPGRARLLLACTDGVTSIEDRVLGRVASGDLWQAVRAPFGIVLDALGTAWPELLAAEAPDGPLAAVLQDALCAALDHGLLDDDATVGALLVRPAKDAA